MRTPVDTVRLFARTYGTAQMDKTAELVTSGFRDNTPESVWTYDRWKALHKIKYKRLDYPVIKAKKNEKRALVCLNSTITTIGSGKGSQKEIYSLVQKNGTWLIDRLEVTDEKLKSEELTL